LHSELQETQKKVYKYDSEDNLVEEYDSVISTAGENNISDKTVSRAIKSGKLCQGYYYRLTPINVDST
jgi:hypothetical protein